MGLFYIQDTLTLELEKISGNKGVKNLLTDHVKSTSYLLQLTHPKFFYLNPHVYVKTMYAF